MKSIQTRLLVLSVFAACVAFSGIAQAIGLKGLKVEDPAELGPALAAAIDSDRPALIDVTISQEAHFRLMM